MVGLGLVDHLKLALREIEEINELREEAIRNSRRWLSIARESILNSREMRDLSAEERKLLDALGEIRSFLEEARSKLGHQDCIIRSVLQDALQEIVEGIALCRLLRGEVAPSHIELGIGAREYLLGIGDVVGELRRVALHHMKIGEINKAEELIEIMEEIYECLSSAAFPDSLIPLRRKADEARILVEKTLSEVIFVKASRRCEIGSHEG